MPWTRPRFWPTWLTRLQSDGWWATRLRLRPAPVVYLPCPRPCPAFGHVDLLRGKAERSPSLATLHDPPLPTRHPDCAAQAAAGQRGLRAVEARGWLPGLRGGTAATGHALLLPAGPAGGPTDAPSGHDGFMHGHSRPFGKQAIPLPLLPTEVPRCRGAREGLVGEVRDGPGFLVQCILEFI